jgi:hypothetical protein
MESRTSDIIKRNFASVSPYQVNINFDYKTTLLEASERKIYFIWGIPIFLTITEIIYLKHNKISKAHRIALFKFISYAMATVVSNFSTGDFLKKLNYIDRLYPLAPQIQREQIRDAEILKNSKIL